MKRILSSIVTAFIALLGVSCTQPIAGGGGSEVEVVGCVYLPGNEPAPATQVKLIPSDYDPSLMAAIGDSMIDTSDMLGRYSFKGVVPGRYNVLAVQLKQRTRMLITGLDVDSGTTTAASKTLLEPGSIKLLLLGAAQHGGYAMIPGTDIAAFVAIGSNEVLLDSVPAGLIPEVRYTVLGDTSAMSRNNVDVAAAVTTTLANPSWRFERRLQLNTSATGADISGDVYEFPVLVRLDEKNFDFGQTRPDGADLRFTAPNGGTLPFEIERWDPVTELAEMWVSVDTIRGNDSTQSITMYWGNTAATHQSGSAAVFDTAVGFAGVWHLAETGNEAALDATGNRFNGTAFNMPENTATTGAIGNARAFDGSSSYIAMPGTATGALNFPEDGHYTISAWVYADSFDNVYRTIVTKGYEQYFLQLSYFPGDKPLWQFSVFTDTTTWNMTHASATERRWVLLTGVQQGTDRFLYCNGAPVAKNTATYPHPGTTILRNTSNDFSIGRFLQEATYPMNFGNCFFKGRIDEVRVCGVARSADWIKLCYMNQRSDDKLVQSGQ